MIGVIDYGAGNLQSVGHALDRLGLPFRVCATPDALDGCDRILLPGVGHFGAAAEALTRSELDVALRQRVEDGTPLLGICLGLQLLFAGSDEAPGVQGLALVPGRTVRLETRRVPHMGWNRVSWRRSDPLAGEKDDDYFYFAHGYVARVEDDEHLVGDVPIETGRYPAVVGRPGVWGVQFHPEKSGPAGLALLERFARC